ncbi:helicase [Burkholderia ubonensis]|uniref:UvrD-helicase domain-containing protein n=1 Tax=Burkholderia ubonensis TaxID=101571 RepID=UPI00075DE27D|nr:UvrD-helicase domain-containing protein [Burkholderia ubonensis]KVC94983.1 helicase [Burkholderia ubonensis]
MSDDVVARLLRSSEPLVVIEASAGCGKTYQGASYAREAIGSVGSGRLLILTHTHAACAVFADRTRSAGSRVEIKTIDALIAQIATAYYKPLGLPCDLSAWAWHDNGKGFDIMAAKVAEFLRLRPMIARALAQRYPIIICDEHQDSSVDQHAIVMALHGGGALLRVFGDPLQRIYGAKTDKAARIDRERWDALKSAGVTGKLNIPHRWRDGCRTLGEWILEARVCLESGQPIDLTGSLPASLRILIGNNIARTRTGYQLSREQRKPIDKLVRGNGQLMILASQNDLVAALRAFWGRAIPIWEGHTREAFAALVDALRKKSGDAEALAEGLIGFVGSVAVGFSRSSHGDRLIEEIRNEATRQTTGKPANIQAIARCLLADPSHLGVASALNLIRTFIETNAAGFDTVKVDLRAEFNDAIRIGQFADADEAFAEISRKRSYSRLSPPQRVLSSIHKAKGLECDNVLVMACDKTQFTRTLYARSKMYVALSRARNSLTLVVPDANPSPLFKLA